MDMLNTTLGNGTSPESFYVQALAMRALLLPEEGGWPEPLFWPVSWAIQAFLSVTTSVSAYLIAIALFPEYTDENAALKAKYNKTSRYGWLSFAGNHIFAGLSGSVSFAVSWYRGNIWWDIVDIPYMTGPELAFHAVYMVAFFWMMVLVYDFLTYVVHRIEHEWRWLYRNMHSQHHENMFPQNPIEAIYGDFIEGAMVSWFYFIQCCVYPTLPASVVGAMAIMIVLSAQWNHSGVHVKVPWLFYDSERHLWHHMEHNCNFAEHTPVWDILFGTAKEGNWAARIKKQA